MPPMRFVSRHGREASKLLGTLLGSEPGPKAKATVLSLKAHPEDLHLKGRALYIYFPDGAGRSKLAWSSLAQLLKTTGTARNWNSVTKMLEIAEELDGSVRPRTV